MARALSSALSAKVRPVSVTSGAPGNDSRPTRPSAKPAASRMRESSEIFPAFRVASTRRGATGSAIKGFLLQPGKLPAPRLGQVEQRGQHRAAKRLAFGGALDLHELPGT